MSVQYQGVQGAHAGMKWLLDDHETQNWNGTLVFVETSDLEKWKFKLSLKEIHFTEFKEPDLDNITTAIAVLGHDKLFSKLKLIGSKE